MLFFWEVIRKNLSNVTLQDNKFGCVMVMQESMF